MKISILTAFILLFFLNNIFAQGKVQKLKISHLKGDFYVYTTYNSIGGKPFPANGMYLVTQKGVVIFDTPWDSTQFQPLLDSIAARHQQKAVMCLSTHSHDDRTAGLAYYKQKGLKTYTTKQTDVLSKAIHNARAEYTFNNDSTFKVGQHTFQTYFAGPGHSPDNIVVWFNKDKVLYGGCLIKSVETTDLGNLEDANVKEWPNTILNVQRKFKTPEYIITGHQGWNSTQALTHTLNLLKKYNKSK
jgi:metallo-beta-lactamase class B